MPEYLTPGVYFEFRDAAPPVRGIRTDIAGFVGLARKGPLDSPVRVDSWRQFQVRFGGPLPQSFLAYAVKGFFENGGRTCFVTRIAGPDAAAASFTFKNKSGLDVLRLTASSEGTWGNRVGFTLQTRPAASEFSLVITSDGPMRESFPRLSVNSDEARYFARVFDERPDAPPTSQLVRLSVVAGLPPGADLLPDAAKSGLKRGVGFLSGGLDGIASLSRTDFIGDPAAPAEEKRGLAAFERVDAVGIICIPDIHVQPALLVQPPAEEQPPHDPCLPGQLAPDAGAPAPFQDAIEQPPVFGETDVLAVGRAMLEHCERQKDRVAILDAPLKTGGFAPTVAEIQNWRAQFDSERGFGALYYPWVKVLDPLRPGGNPTRAVPPCGHIAGLYARTDFEVGVHKAPANAELFWTTDVTAPVDDETQAILNPLGINCVRAFPGRGIRVHGARTVSSDSDWRYVNVRRLMSMIEEAVEEATQWSVFEPNSFYLRQELVVSISTFLETVWRTGALTGATAREAFYVKCDETNNPPEVLDRGQLVVEIGIAPTRPAEFIIFRIGRTTAELEAVGR